MIEFIVWVWLGSAYDTPPIKVGHFENCTEGARVSRELYPDQVAMHCILPIYNPPGVYNPQGVVGVSL